MSDHLETRAAERGGLPSQATPGQAVAAAAPVYSNDDLMRWSKQISTITGHTGKEERRGRHGHHGETQRLDGEQPGAPMSVKDILVLSHHPFPKDAFDAFIAMEPRLSWVSKEEPFGWTSWKVSCIPGRH